MPSRVCFRLAPTLIVGLMVVGVVSAETAVLRVLPEGKRPDDQRLGRLVHLRKDYFPFTPPATPEQWAEQSERIGRRVKVAAGIWPMPTKTPANAVVHGLVDRGDYTVEKVYFESFPGHFVTGNLYRPKGREGKLPGVLCPHGHFANGRFYDLGANDVRWSLVRGEERFEVGGRSPLQSRCVQLARMGCVVFHYDMVGYADSQQVGHYAGVRPEMNTPERWGYYSPGAEARLQTLFGLQTYNSIRTLDWFAALPDVDPARIAVTGCSGGGTQTFILLAVDPRPAVAFPAVMVSTAMQGGCTCENGSYLRIDCGNVDIAALAAPRPLGMTGADDWTKEIAAKGLPELKRLYKMLGVEDLVMARPLVHFPHNYNYVSRAVMYHWLNKHLGLGFDEPIVEEDYQPLSIAEMSVWNDDHSRPPSGPEYERSLLEWITADSDRQMAQLVPTDRASLERFREVVGGAVDIMIGRGLPAAGEVVAIGREDGELGAWRMSRMLLREESRNEEIPAILLEPKGEYDRVVVWIDRAGKQGMLDDDGMPRKEIEGFLSAGSAVLGVDLFGQGEFTEDGKPLAKAPMNRDGDGPTQAYAGYTFGYNPPVFSARVHDVLKAVAFARQLAKPEPRVWLFGLDGAGHWVAAARAQAGDAVELAAIDTAGFRFADVAACDDPDFLPGGAKYLDLPGIIALSAPQPIWLLGESEVPPVVKAAYEASGHPESLQKTHIAPDGSTTVPW